MYSKHSILNRRERLCLDLAKERITSDTDSQTGEQVSPHVPDQQTFHEHLRTLTRHAVRVVIEEVMREELKAFLGAAWGESTPQRKGYRNGTYSRDLATSSGPIEDLRVPRDREGNFHTQVFDRYSRYEPQGAEGFTQMFGASVSTEKVGEVARSADRSGSECEYSQLSQPNADRTI